MEQNLALKKSDYGDICKKFKRGDLFYDKGFKCFYILLDVKDYGYEMLPSTKTSKQFNDLEYVGGVEFVAHNLNMRVNQVFYLDHLEAGYIVKL